MDWISLENLTPADGELVALALFRAGYTVRQRKQKDGDKTVIQIECSDTPSLKLDRSFPPAIPAERGTSVVLGYSFMELKHCPFCKGAVTHSVGVMEQDLFMCKKCGAIVKFKYGYYNSHKEAINAWNRRCADAEQDH